MSETDQVAVATAPLTAPEVRQKLQPVAGMSPEAAQPVVSPPPMPVEQITPPSPSPAPVPQPDMRTSVFSAAGHPQSPWTAGSAKVVPKQQKAAFADTLGTPAGIPETDSGIEGVRKLLIGRQMGEMQTKVAELQLSLNGEMKRLREVLLGRVDEMASFLHRDMVVLRGEMQQEMAQMKADLFTMATGLSSVKDRLMMLETKSREETTSALAEMECRIARQEGAFASALDNIENKWSTAIDSKCNNAMSVLAKKSDVAELLANMGVLVAQVPPTTEPPAMEPQMMEVECDKVTPPPPIPQYSTGAGDSWAELAHSLPVEGTAGDWVLSKNPYMADEGLIT